MFRKILIANRGEIACRVMRTASLMGIRTVAVYSDADADALHTVMADEAVRIGPAPVSDSYLRIDAIIDACKRTGAEAVHPGYGFLSENPAFAERLEKEGIAFIGPPAPAIRAMGLKDAAKQLMQKAGVPVVPGYHGEKQGAEALSVEAQQIGYPVLIKARAGGGGKGMRRVDIKEEFAEALASAKSEGEKSFGDGHVLIEKYVTRPRHIEVQVFADRHNPPVYLFERDCSLQRRHQKVIEEAPAPGMTAGMRAAMGEAAVRAAAAIGYEGAGTVEFLVDASDGLRADRFYFMEMNTRLQVEHPVTEAITGVDLVEWQIRAAAGEAITPAQDDLEFFGHAFEARVYAEDAARGFLPATGRLERMVMPEAVARVDTGVREGDTVTAHYDPMIAKVIVHDRTRTAALAKLNTALNGTRIAGTVTNVEFLRALASDPGFAAGDVDTGLIERGMDRFAPAPPASPDAEALAALAALGLPGEAGDDPWDALSGFRAWGIAKQSVTILRGREAVEASVRIHAPGRYGVRIDGAVREVVFGTSNRIDIDGRRFSVETLRRGSDVLVLMDGDAYTYGTRDPLAVTAGAGPGGDAITAPMPGTILHVAAKPGDAVEAAQTLVVMEAMKMEQSLKSPRTGTIAQVLVAEGDQVGDGDTLVTLEAEGEA